MITRQRKPPVDNRIERQIILGMVVSDRFLREIQPMLKGNDFQVDYISTIASWCLDYWNKYQQAPKKNIEDVFHTHKKEFSEDIIESIENFMSGLDEEYEKDDNHFNAEYILDKAENYFRACALKNLQTQIQQYLMGDRLDEAEEAIKEYQRPQRPQNKGVDPIRDTNAITQALKPDEENEDIVIQLPGALGKACGPLERGCLIAIQAESGVGKTWWLLLLALLCVLKGFNIIFYSLEMAIRKMIRRIWQDILSVPTRGDGLVKIPTFDCVLNQSNECRLKKRKGKVKISSVDYVPCDACRDNWDMGMMTVYHIEVKKDLLDPALAIHKHMIMERTGMLKRLGRFHLIEYPSNEITFSEAKTYMNNLEYYDDFIPDVFITDYADKFKWDIPRDARNSIGLIWGGHKGLAQGKHCLGITASQSNTERSGKRVGKASWAETIEKRRMLDLGIAFNQSDEDYEKGIMYANIDKLRDGERIGTAEVAILQSLTIGRPYIDSCFVKKKIKRE